MIFKREFLQLDSYLRRHIPSADAFDSLLRREGTVYRNLECRQTIQTQVGGKKYFIKIHRGCGWKEILKNLLCARWPILSAQTEWRAIERLQSLGIATVSISGKGLRGLNPATLESFLVTEALEGMVSLEELAQTWSGLSGKKQIELKHVLIRKLADIARKLHGGGLNHRDFYLCHFLVKDRVWHAWNRNQALEVFLIDLHRVQIRSRVPTRWVVKDLAGLLFSAMDIPLTKRDLFRFTKVYRGKSLSEVLRMEATFWRHVLRKAEKLYAKVHRRQPPDLAGQTKPI